MKKIIIVAMALFLVASTSDAMAQSMATLRLGGGVITKGSVPGGGLNLTLNKAESPLALGITAELYSKSGTRQVPIGVLGMFQKSNESDKVTFFVGAGGGIISIKAGGTSTKGMATGLAGLPFYFSEKAGVYAKCQFYRAITSGATNSFSVGGGIAIALCS